MITAKLVPCLICENMYTYEYMYIYIYIYVLVYLCIYIYMLNRIYCTWRTIPIIQTIGKVGFEWTTWIWLANTMSKPIFHETMKWSHGRYRHFACGALFETQKKVRDWRAHAVINKNVHQYIYFSRKCVWAWWGLPGCRRRVFLCCENDASSMFWYVISLVRSSRLPQALFFREQNCS